MAMLLSMRSVQVIIITTMMYRPGQGGSVCAANRDSCIFCPDLVCGLHAPDGRQHATLKTLVSGLHKYNLTTQLVTPETAQPQACLTQFLYQLDAMLAITGSRNRCVHIRRIQDAQYSIFKLIN